MEKIRTRKRPVLVIPLEAKRPTFKKCRNIKGSQREVGNIIGVTEGSVRFTENGITNPTLLVAFKYALYFGIPIEELFPDLLHKARENLCNSL